MKSRRRRSSGTRQALASHENTLLGGLVPAAVGAGASVDDLLGVRLGVVVVGRARDRLARRTLRFFGTGSPRSQVTVPPAASIFSFADFEKPCAETESCFVSSPEPRILTSTCVLADQPLSP